MLKEKILMQKLNMSGEACESIHPNKITFSYNLHARKFAKGTLLFYMKCKGYHETVHSY